MQLQLVIITNQNKLVIYYISGSDVSSHMVTYAPLQYPYEVDLLFLLLT